MFKFVNTNTVEDSAQNVWLSLLLDFYISPTVGGAGSSGINLHNYSPFLLCKCLSERETQETNCCQINKQTQKIIQRAKNRGFRLILFTKIVFPHFICMFCILWRVNTALYRKIWNKYFQNWGKIGGPIVGIYKSLTDTRMWKLGTRPRAVSFLGIHKPDLVCSEV
jgi:hypothetical protein